MRADLHVHSLFSDGTMSPQELLQEAKRIGLQGLSITDHDSISAFSVGQALAEELQLIFIPGIEISAEMQKTPIHVLGYSFIPNHPCLLEKCSIHRQHRVDRNRKILEKLHDLGMSITEEDLGGVETIGRPHIANAMLQKGYVTSIQEAFVRYLGDHKRGYVSGEKWTVAEAIDMIHQAQGLAILAHPHLIAKKSLIRKLLALPFDGIEVNYGYFDRHVTAYWMQMCRERRLLATGGSDFHGSIKPQIAMGASVCPENDLATLVEHFRAVS